MSGCGAAGAECAAVPGVGEGREPVPVPPDWRSNTSSKPRLGPKFHILPLSPQTCAARSVGAGTDAGLRLREGTQAAAVCGFVSCRCQKALDLNTILNKMRDGR